jgi:hypothetical protein
MSTSTARFQEIEARLQQQQKEFHRKDWIKTEHLECMGRQFTRFDDLDNRQVRHNGRKFDEHYAEQAAVGRAMNKLSDKISALLDMIALVNLQTGNASAISTLNSDTKQQRHRHWKPQVSRHISLTLQFASQIASPFHHPSRRSIGLAHKATNWKTSAVQTRQKALTSALIGKQSVPLRMKYRMQLCP